jgi:hypothetical protein
VNELELDVGLYFGPGMFCEQPGANAAETACELNTAKTLSKFLASMNKCYDRCVTRLRKGLIPAGSCTPASPADPLTAACIGAASAKSIRGVDRKCGHVGALPDCRATDDYPNGTYWTHAIDVVFSFFIGNTYCASPTGAFLD